MDLLEHLRAIDEMIDTRKKQVEQDFLLETGSDLGQGLGFAAATGVPWSQNSPWATQRDFDNDGIVDALDNYPGPGANPPPMPGQSSNVPWSQNSPWAHQQDFDGDGISNALDNHPGPGAEDDG